MVIILIMVYGAGFITGYLAKKQNVKVIKETKIKTNYIYRKDITCEDAFKALQCYDTSMPKLDFMVDNSKITAQAGLCERQWERSIYIQQDDNWRYYVGIGIVGGMTFTWILYKITR